VPTTRVEFGIWRVTAERSQIDPLIAETAGEATGLVDSAAARFSSRPPQLAASFVSGGAAFSVRASVNAPSHVLPELTARRSPGLRCVSGAAALSYMTA